MTAGQCDVYTQKKKQFTVPFYFILHCSFTNLFHIRFGWYYRTQVKRVHHLERQCTQANRLDIDWGL